MKVPKHVVKDAQEHALGLFRSGHIRTNTELWQHAMLYIKTRYHSAKTRAVQYGFINEPGKVAYAIPCICRMQSVSSACGVKEHVLPEGVALRHVAEWVLRPFRNHKGLGG